MSVLDEVTSKRLFGGDMFGGILSALSGGKSDDFSHTPTTDLQAINERLDAIGELVGNDDLRKTFSQLVYLLELPFNELYVALGLVKDPMGLRFGRNLGSIVKELGGYSTDLPAFDGYDVQSGVLNGVIERYEAVAAGEAGIKAALEYFSGLKQQVLDKEEQLRKEKDQKAGEDIYSAFSALIGRKPSIDRKTLEGMIDMDKVKSFYPAIELIPSISRIAGLYSRLAKTAVDNNYVRPEVVPREENCLAIEGGWYDTNRVKEPVRNSTQFTPERRVEVVEGVNSGGKTFDMMKALQIASMALAGTWVPAKYARVSIRDKIILREKGTGETMSAFEQDCESANECTPVDGQYRFTGREWRLDELASKNGEYWLIGLDETFTSTEKVGGAALTYGLINMVLGQGNSVMILSSHYPELHQVLRDTPGVAFTHFPFEVKGGDEVVFPHVKHEGPMDDYSYAIAVARTHKFPDARILELAEQRLRQ